MKKWLMLGCVLAMSVCGYGGARAEVTLQARGLLDLTAAGGSRSNERNLTTFGDSNYDPYRLRLFLDAAVADGLDLYVQTLLAEGTSVRADGAYALWTPWRERDLHLEAGKIPWPVGTWAPRKYSDKNALIGEPLMYQHHTSLPWNRIPDDIEDLLEYAGQGQGQIARHGDWVGMPVVDDRWWDAGVVALGSARPLEFALGVTQGAPGWPEPGHEDVPGQSVLGRLGFVPSPAVRVGVSGSIGPWVPRYFAYALPPGKALRDFEEQLVMGDFEFQGRDSEVHAEGYVKTWQTMTTGDLVVRGGYVESRVGLGAVLWLAGRAEVMRFSDVTPSTGATRPWDDPLDRYEVGLGARASREVRIKLSMQRDVIRRPGEPVENADTFALASSIRF
jgi:hypothetical protein